jgi:muconate cycloisomerase
MTRPLPIARMTLYQLAIPMRQRFRHSAGVREVSEPLIVAIELANGITGFGETHPREYVTGESSEAAAATIRDFFLPLLVDIRPAGFGEAVEAADALPLRDQAGRVVTAARAAVELALLDAYSRAFLRSMEHAAGWLTDTGLGEPGSRATARFSGVLSGDDPARTTRSIRRMRLFGLRHFKVKVGDAAEQARLVAAMRVLGRTLQAGRATLRLDANGAWTPQQARQRLGEWGRLPITCVEQPLGKVCLEEWTALAAESRIPLMADESLVTPEDADDLIRRRAAAWFNIRLSKNGGLLPALRLALLAARHGIHCQLGCMVGETSLLAAAGRWFLQLVPRISIAEGSFGRFLLSGDVTRKPLRFSYGGRWKAMAGCGWGAGVEEGLLREFSSRPPAVMPV